MQFDALWLNAMIRIYNGKILKFIDNGIELTPDELWIKNQKIVYIGPAQNESPDFEKTINLEGNILMPGFSNAHTHSLMILFRSMFNRKPLFEWLKCVSPLEKMITQEDAYVIAKFAIMNYLMNGVTSTFDMCPMRYVETYINANIDSGFRTSVCCAISLNSRKRLDSVESLYCRYNNFNPLIRYLLGFHSIYNTDEDILKRIAELGRKYRAPVFMHNSETADEIRYSNEKYGMSPTRFFDNLGLFEFGGGSFHCTHLSSEDMDIFFRKKLYSVMNITSNLWLESGVPPIDQLFRKNIRLAFGTDGAGSNNGIDMFCEMRLFALLQKIGEEKKAPSYTEILKNATLNGARLMGFRNCGSIVVGGDADLIVIDVSKANMLPMTNFADNIVMSCNSGNVVTTIVGGKILYDHGRYFIGDNSSEIQSRMEQIKNRILGA